MAQTSNHRRFYIDHGVDQPVVRTVPVRRARPSTNHESIATHQVAQATARTNPARIIADRARRAPKAVSRIVQTARKNADR